MSRFTKTGPQTRDRSAASARYQPVLRGIPAKLLGDEVAHCHELGHGVEFVDTQVGEDLPVRCRPSTVRTPDIGRMRPASVISRAVRPEPTGRTGPHGPFIRIPARSPQALAAQARRFPVVIVAGHQHRATAAPSSVEVCRMSTSRLERGSPAEIKLSPCRAPPPAQRNHGRRAIPRAA